MKAKFQPGMFIRHLYSVSCLTFGCAQEKDFYEPDNNPLPNENEYFGFETRKDLNLNVNYDTPINALVEVYTEEQIETVNGNPGIKAGEEALFKIYTDAAGKFSGKMDLPAVYTAAWGLPRFIKLKVDNGSVDLGLTKTATSKSTKAAVTRSHNFGASIPYPVYTNKNLYSLTPWGSYGALDYYVDNTGEHFITGYLTPTSTVRNETVGEFADRLIRAPPRIEVHLPKHKPTDKIDAALVGTGDDAYYIDKDGLYPFAIDLPITGFSQTVERTAIGEVYPDFAKWVESKGEKATDWYNNRKK